MCKEVDKPKEQRPLFFFSGFIVMFVFAGLADGVFFNPNVNGLISLIAGLLFIVFFGLVLKQTIPRCPSCNHGIYSLVEKKGYPLVLKPCSGDKCNGCGAKFKT
jgi:hypothetical protein